MKKYILALMIIMISFNVWGGSTCPNTEPSCDIEDLIVNGNIGIGTNTPVAELDIRGSAILPTADVLVDADGDATTGAGTADSHVDAVVMVGIEEDSIDFNDDDAADGVAMCTDSLTSPAHVRIDIDTDCGNNSGTDGTYILGSTAATIRVGLLASASAENAWAFVDEDADDLYDNGEDLYVDKFPLLSFYNSGVGDISSGGDMLVGGHMGIGGDAEISSIILAIKEINRDFLTLGGGGLSVWYQLDPELGGFGSVSNGIQVVSIGSQYAAHDTVGLAVNNKIKGKTSIDSLALGLSSALTFNSTMNDSDTIDTCTNGTPELIITAASHPFKEGDKVHVSGSVCNLSSANGTDYWVVNVTTNTFNLDDTGVTGASLIAFTADDSAGETIREISTVPIAEVLDVNISAPNTNARNWDVGTLYGLRIANNNDGTVAGKVDIDNLYMAAIDAIPTTANKSFTTGVITNASALWIGKTVIADTNNYGIVLDGDGVGADIVFGDGQDDKIYHDGTNLVLNPATGINFATLPSGTGASNAGVTGTVVTLCYTTTGDLFVDTDGTCSD